MKCPWCWRDMPNDAYNNKFNGFCSYRCLKETTRYDFKIETTSRESGEGKSGVS